MSNELINNTVSKVHAAIEANLNKWDEDEGKEHLPSDEEWIDQVSTRNHFQEQHEYLTELLEKVEDSYTDDLIEIPANVKTAEEFSKWIKEY